MRPILRFLLWVALPAPLVLGVLWASVDRAQADQHRLGMERLGQAAALLFNQDLGRATVALSRIAEPWPEADPADPAVQRASAGDTLSGMSAAPDGVRISLILPNTAAVDSSAPAVSRAVGRLRSQILENFRGLTGFGAAFYLNAAWAAGDSLAPAALPGDWLQSVESGEGFAEFDLDTGHAFLMPASGPGTGASASSAGLLLIERDPPRGPLGPLAVAIPVLLIMLSMAVVLMGLTPSRRTARRAPRMALGGLMALLITIVGSGGWAASRGMEASKAESIRELTRTGALLRAYNRLDDPETAAALTGHRALFINNAGGIHTSDGQDPPVGVESLPTPPPAFPAAGQLASSGEIYLVMRSEHGRSVLLLPRYEAPLPLWIAIFGGIIIAFGTTMFLKSGLFAMNGTDSADEAREAEAPAPA